MGNKDNRVLRHACLNSYFQTGYKNLMDHASPPQDRGGGNTLTQG